MFWYISLIINSTIPQKDLHPFWSRLVYKFQGLACVAAVGMTEITHQNDV